MHIRWFGHAAFLLSGEQVVFIDPFGPPLDRMTAQGNTFSYPPIEGVEADLLLITHEHFDHNAAGRVGGSPVVIRSTPGRFTSPAGEVTGVASEHDDAGGTERGANTIFVFTLNGMRICHFGDFGQAALRPEQRAALGDVDVLLIPVGGGPTIGAATAAAITRELNPGVVIPMHYGTMHVNWLEPVDNFLSVLDWDVVDLPTAAAVNNLTGTTANPTAAVFATPVARE